MKKSFLSLSLVLVLLLSLSIQTVWAYEGEGGLVDKGEVVLLIDNANAVVKGRKIPIDKDNQKLVPFEQDKSIFLPLNFTCGLYGAKVNWNAQANTISIDYTNTQASVTVGNTTMSLNGSSVTLEQPIQVVNGNLFICLADIARILNKKSLHSNGFIYLSDKEITSSAEKEDLLNDILSGTFEGGEPSGKGLPEGGTLEGGDASSSNVTMNDITNKYLAVPYAGLSPSQNMDIYLPQSGNGPFPLIVAVHGGAFAGGNARGGIITNTLQGVDRGYAVASINYRLSGEAKFPAAINDVKAAIRFLKANASKYNIDPNRIAVWGESAGGNLAAMAGTSADDKTIENDVFENLNYSSGVQAVVDWYGPLDFLAMDEQFALSEVTPKNPPTNTEGSPESRYIGQLISNNPTLTKQADAGSYAHLLTSSNSPYFFIQHGLADANVPYQQSENFAKTLEEIIGKNKVTLELMPGAGHGTAEFRSQFNIDKVFAFLDDVLGAKATVQESGDLATPSATNIQVNGSSKSVDAYMINGSNYIKLRDIAAMINNTPKNFEILWNNADNAINLISKTNYTPIGGEMTKGSGMSVMATKTPSKVYLDGKEVSLTAYLIGGSNYFKLRDIMQLMNAYVGYDNATGTAVIDTDKGYAIQ